MTTEEIARWIADLLTNDVDMQFEVLEGTTGVDRPDDNIFINSFNQSGLMTRDDGVVLDLGTAGQFQITVVRSR